MPQPSQPAVIELDALEAIHGGRDYIVGLREDNHFANKEQIARVNRCFTRVEEADLYKPWTWTLQTYKSCYSTLLDSVRKNPEMVK